MGVMSIFRRPRAGGISFGLALGSGGAKGAAHLGALRAFEEAGIGFDVVAGASIGSIVGALVAYGYSSTDIYGLVRAADLGEYAKALFLRPDGEGFSGVIERFLGGVRGFEELKLPFAAVATDLASGEAKVFTSGLLAPALAASSAMPPFFRPVRIGERDYLDGAFSDPVPADVCRTLGANFVVAIDLATYSAGSGAGAAVVEKLYPGSGIDASGARERGRSAADVVIDPKLAGYHATAVRDLDAMYDLGYSAAAEVVPEIEAVRARFGKGGKKERRR